jgi:hypothetical protein
VIVGERALIFALAFALKSLPKTPKTPKNKKGQLKGTVWGSFEPGDPAGELGGIRGEPSVCITLPALPCRYYPVDITLGQ